MKKINLALSACVALCGVVFADENAKAYELETIVVSSQISGVNSQIDSDKISVRNAGLLRDILRDVPGVYVGGTNSVHQKIYMRGTSERGLNVTIDGARQRGAVFHHAGDLYLDPDIIKSVDIGFSANSVVGNSGSLAGSVAFKTIDAKDLLGDESFGGKIKGGYASNNKEWQESLMLYGKPLENVDILGYINHRGYKQGKDGYGEKIGGDNAKNLNYLLKMGIDVNDYSRLTLSGEKMSIKGDFRRLPERTISGDLTPTQATRETYAIMFNSNPNDFVNLETNLYFTDHKFESDFLTYDYLSGKPATKSYGGKVINKTFFGTTDGLSQTFVYGSEYYITKGYNKSDNPPSNGKGEKVNSLSFFLEDQIRYGGFTFTPGIRYDYHKLSTLDDSSYSWNAFSPGVSLDYQFENGFGAYTSWAKTFRGPEVSEAEQYQYNAASIIHNPDLKPEKGDAFEGGIRYLAQISNNQSLSFAAKYFYNDYENLILDYFRYSSGSRAKQNVGNASVKGFELSAKYNIENLSLSASYSRARTDYKDSLGTNLTNSTLAYSDSGDKFGFNAEYFISGLNTLIGYNLIAFNKIDTKTSTGTQIHKPGYAVNDLYLSWIPSGKFDGLEVNFGIYNIFDKGYWSHAQKANTDRATGKFIGPIEYEPGRNIKASISYKF
ncbi:MULTISPECIES: TonB-dependent receptor domain-containing protein [unclassified Campylobacter]|uniref:TonB-dependent receptor domain-containing protein n=1 Tax=unclassified Campylobacter TaxID=2593542 RepID=UPI0022E9E6AE|nr:MULTISPECIES: TonB-dependent receptor [unclassified Campylobacter]MDA3078859.1 TonB-dependent receptor [Campylobacter sp. CS_NA2]MDA3080850.1 TonB-dependent receptor [Campylobacter sp. CS_NA1]MDA3084944.1 TonB-dependent receptor [Campylobacter sp. CS_ED1]MDA3089722.1 TonB-dependent receptor [Campylobacter sp. CS_ED2]WBR51718.1 TonB-dependent receptor [Campylobacter sp. CS_NA3]